MQRRKRIDAAGHGFTPAVAIFTIAALVLGGLSPRAWAFDEAAFAHDQIPSARLSGHAELRRYGLLIYDAKLFVGDGGIVDKQLAAKPLVLDRHYARAFTGRHLASIARQAMDDEGLANHAKTAAWEKQLGQFLPDMAAGQHLSAVFTPGHGTTFYAEGKRVGDIPGDEFASAFFAIWLDESSYTPGLRRSLLDDAMARSNGQQTQRD
ncbi:MAG: chalcone isomerase family protein [Janthinobacterium lividum]